MIAAPAEKSGGSRLLRRLGESALFILLYCVSARLLVATQLGGAAPNLFWLPAGIALTGVLLRGREIVPAIVIATLYVQYHLLSSGSPPTLPMIMAIMLSTSGSVLQPWFTAKLLKLTLRSMQILHVSDAMKFILCAALGATISSITGILALLSQNRIADDTISLNLLTWWVGDLSGMLVVAPAVLTARYWSRGKREWGLLSLPIIGLGFSFTLITAFIVQHLDHDARIKEFMSSGAVMGQALQRSLALSERDLIAAGTFFYNYAPDADEFHNFSTNLFEQNRLIRSLSWAPLVPGNQRRAFEEKYGFGLKDRLPDGSMKPAAKADRYLPVLMSEPLGTAASIYGFNILTSPASGSAVLAALATGQARATRLVNTVRTGRAVILYRPVYQDEYRRSSNAPDNTRLRGFLSMAVEITGIAEDALSPFEARQAEVWLIDVTDAGSPQLLYHRIAGKEAVPAASDYLDPATLRHGIYQESQHRFAGRDWVLISKPHSLEGAFMASSQFLGILAAGFSLTLILALYMVGRQRSENVMQERDERLMSQNAVLTHLAHVGLSPASDHDTQLRELLATSAVTLRLEYVGLWRVDREQGVLRCVVMFRQSTGDFIDVAPIDIVDVPHYLAALEQGRALVVSDVKAESRTFQLLEKRFSQYGITAVMDIPLRIDGCIDGVLTHWHVGATRMWEQDEQNFASSIGDLAVLAIESKLRHKAEQALKISHETLETRVKERTEELRQANERLLELDRMKSMFIASMSHQLRTPLNSILGFTGLTLQGASGPLNATQTDHLGRVLAAAKHLLAMITDVIDISRIEAGHVDVHVQPFPLDLLVNEAIASLQPQREAKNLDIEVDSAGTILAHTDRKRLFQCLLNLLSNAIKYSERGTIKVRLREDGARIAIDVEDNGIGIPPEAMGKLFQPFERIESHLRIQMPGTGLGLYLTKKLMTELLYGDVTVTSTPDVGSCFTLWLPRQFPRPLTIPVLKPTEAHPSGDKLGKEDSDGKAVR